MKITHIAIIDIIALGLLIIAAASAEKTETYSANYICEECGDSCKMIEQRLVTTQHREGQDYIYITYLCENCNETYLIEKTS